MDNLILLDETVKKIKVHMLFSRKGGRIFAASFKMKQNNLQQQ